MKVTLQYIADKAGVSRSLVSKVLNNKPVRVSAQKRAQIIRIAQKHNYTPQGIASEGKLPFLRKKKVIGILQPELNFYFLTQLTDEIEKNLRREGYSSIIFNSHEDPQDVYKRQVKYTSHSLNSILSLNLLPNIPCGQSNGFAIFPPAPHRMR